MTVTEQELQQNNRIIEVQGTAERYPKKPSATSITPSIFPVKLTTIRFNSGSGLGKLYIQVHREKRIN